MADPFIRGILAGDVRETSVQAMLTRLKAAEDKYGSVIRHLHKIQEPTTGILSVFKF